MEIYLDNAATTPVDPQVFEAMVPYLRDHFGNPSSTHARGRETRAAIEKARKMIATELNCTPGEIYFTSGGTEADNTAIYGAIQSFDLKHAITSPIEHHAVLHTLERLAEQGKIKLSLVKIDKHGSINMDHLRELLETNSRSLVSFMHANNEIGNWNNLEAIGNLCREFDALFHSDTVQGITHFRYDLQKLPVDFIVCSAHKFHGPKGVGFLYIRKGLNIEPLVHGGGQEKQMRGGTESAYSIVGLATAFQLGYAHHEEDKEYIQGLKDHMISELRRHIPGVEFNGLCDDASASLYTVLNVSIPKNSRSDMMLFNLDLNGICVSGGSACSSGALKGSHVLASLGHDEDRTAIRFSFSKNNTIEEIDTAVGKLAEVLQVNAPDEA